MDMNSSFGLTISKNKNNANYSLLLVLATTKQLQIINKI